MKNSLKLSKDHVDKWVAAKAIVGDLEEPIIERIDYILNYWFSAFDGKLDYWYFPDAGEGEVGDLYSNMTLDTINKFVVCLEKQPSDYEMCIIDQDGDEYTWCNEIPTRWLFEDFESEIVEGKMKAIKAEEDNKAKRKALLENKKLKDKKLLTEVFTKLSKEELAAIKRNHTLI